MLRTTWVRCSVAGDPPSGEGTVTAYSTTQISASSSGRFGSTIAGASSRPWSRRRTRLRTPTSSNCNSSTDGTTMRSHGYEEVVAANASGADVPLTTARTCWSPQVSAGNWMGTDTDRRSPTSMRSRRTGGTKPLGSSTGPAEMMTVASLTATLPVLTTSNWNVRCGPAPSHVRQVSSPSNSTFSTSRRRSAGATTVPSPGWLLGAPGMSTAVVALAVPVWLSARITQGHGEGGTTTGTRPRSVPSSSDATTCAVSTAQSDEPDRASDPQTSSWTSTLAGHPRPSTLKVCPGTSASPMTELSTTSMTG